MLDINYIQENKEYVIENLNRRNKDYTNDIENLVQLNILRKKNLVEIENLKYNKNQISKKIGIHIRNNELDEVSKIKNEVKNIDEKIFLLDKELKNINFDIDKNIRYIPNIINDDIPNGIDENNNIEIKRWNDNLISHKTPHWEIATKLNLVNFELGAKISGSRFLVYTGLGSKIVRALSDILLNEHIKNEYKEITVPLIVNEEAMFGTGQLPKFKDDAYQTNNQYLIPTSEVPLVNIHSNEILNSNELPKKYTAFSQCFRQEAGSAGRDTRGMIRLHQFNKVELVKITNQESSYDELEKMLKDAENILKIFNLPYRVVELCSGDIGFSAMKTYDIEVWFPFQNKFREISSCSNCGDFQARNLSIRYKDDKTNKLAHTLNGSGVAIDRLFAAILENYWDGEKFIIPEILRPYLDNIKSIG